MKVSRSDTCVPIDNGDDVHVEFRGYFLVQKSALLFSCEFCFHCRGLTILRKSAFSTSNYMIFYIRNTNLQKHLGLHTFFYKNHEAQIGKMLRIDSLDSNTNLSFN